ncbi:hypothetical protein N7466_003762 [Penicillium verhagenii]|uniref:uncharacterized protein n=1 Tax=Penicillium verhagenii TaxID=1562060 RepID=UPI002544EECF|nr:uncharacterized protein N7466_003762 [Penicillium verhagenii]KAJ5934215.1 hypothetical protein N7466_003762 [Penicillium verhagenii]
MSLQSSDPLISNPFRTHHVYNDPTEPFLSTMRNGYQSNTMFDNLAPPRSNHTSTLPPPHNGVQSWTTSTLAGDRPSGTTIHDRQHNNRESTTTFICKWDNCRKPSFQSKGSLMRHIDTQHVAPRSFKCSEESCNRFFGRKDNMEEHVRRVHWVRA